MMKRYRRNYSSGASYLRLPGFLTENMRMMYSIITPAAKPPICAHHATPAPEADAVIDAAPLKN